MSTVAVGKLAPAFELSGMDGGNHALKDALARGPVLAAFFKVAFPTCQYAFPFLERLYRQFHANGVQFWGIAQDSAASAQRFAKEFGVTFPILIDEEPYETSREYRLKFVPALFLIAPDGKVQISGDGFSKRDLLQVQKYFARYLSVSPPPLFQAGESVPEYKPG